MRYRYLLGPICLASALAAGCGDDEPAVPDYDADAVSDLTVTATTPHCAWLLWTAPTVAGSHAGGYEIRYREGSFSTEDWDAATAVDDPPLPETPDASQSFAVYGLPAGVTLVFRLRYGLNGWSSDLSNPASVEMPPGAPVPDGFAYVPEGTFTIGSPRTERGRDDDEVRHQVTLSRPLFVGEHEVTQAEYEAVMGIDPSRFPGTEQPVEQVSWYDAVAYCNARSVAEKLAPAYTIAGTVVAWDREAEGYRLLTEAEWEVACRAGTLSAFYSGSLHRLGCVEDDSLTPVAVYCVTDVAGDNDDDGDTDGPDGPAAVGQLLANAWGLRDMHGNVSEWCWDWYRPAYSGDTVDPTGPENGALRVVRGGGWTSPVEFCRSAARSGADPATANYARGIRVARWGD